MSLDVNIKHETNKIKRLIEVIDCVIKAFRLFYYLSSSIKPSKLCEFFPMVTTFTENRVIYRMLQNSKPHRMTSTNLMKTCQ